MAQPKWCEVAHSFRNLASWTESACKRKKNTTSGIKTHMTRKTKFKRMIWNVAAELCEQKDNLIIRMQTLHVERRDCGFIWDTKSNSMNEMEPEKKMRRTWLDCQIGSFETEHWLQVPRKCEWTCPLAIAASKSFCETLKKDYQRKNETNITLNKPALFSSRAANGPSTGSWQMAWNTRIKLSMWSRNTWRTPPIRNSLVKTSKKLARRKFGTATPSNPRR